MGWVGREPTRRQLLWRRGKGIAGLQIHIWPVHSFSSLCSGPQQAPKRIRRYEQHRSAFQRFLGGAMNAETPASRGCSSATQLSTRRDGGGPARQDPTPCHLVRCAAPVLCSMLCCTVPHRPGSPVGNRRVPRPALGDTGRQGSQDPGCSCPRIIPRTTSRLVPGMLAAGGLVSWGLRRWSVPLCCRPRWIQPANACPGLYG